MQHSNYKDFGCSLGRNMALRRFDGRLEELEGAPSQPQAFSGTHTASHVLTQHSRAGSTVSEGYTDGARTNRPYHSRPWICLCPH